MDIGSPAIGTIERSMKAREAKSNGAGGRARAASNGHASSPNVDWRERIQGPRITDPGERQAALKRASGRIKTDVRVDLTRERRGR